MPDPKPHARPSEVEALAPYWADIRYLCGLFGEAPYRFAALVLRESWAGWALTPRGPGGTGDFAPRRHVRAPGLREVFDPGGSSLGFLPADGGGWGRGLCQIDYGSWWDWLGRNDWTVPTIAFRQGLSALAFGHRYMTSGPTTVNDPVLAERAAYAAYNAGPGRVLRAALMGEDPDGVTTGGDYSKWIFTKADELRQILPAQPAKGKS